MGVPNIFLEMMSGLLFFSFVADRVMERIAPSHAKANGKWTDLINQSPCMGRTPGMLSICSMFSAPNELLCRLKGIN